MSSGPSELETLAGSRAEDGSQLPIDSYDDIDELDSFAVEVLGARAAVPTPRLDPGTVVDSTYRIVRVIGAGAMGVVYEAVDQMLERRVALKLHDRAPRPDRASRMWREAKAMARLADPNVVTVHEVGWHHGHVYIAMELIDGANVRAWGKQQSRSWREVIAVYVQAAKGLHAAHRAGIVHRDFKPDNILVGNDGRVRVADFGLARAAGGVVGAAATETSPALGDITQTGVAVGTPAYMAPEQIAGRRVEPIADQFAFCVALYESLWGHRPFVGDTLPELMASMIVDEPLAPPSDTSVPRRVHEILRRGLKKEPADRWPDMATLADALQRSTVNERARVGAFVLGLAVVGAAAWFFGARTQAVSPCEGIDAPMDDTWNALRRIEVERAFTATGSHLAPSGWARVGQGLDTWADAWKATRLDACESTRVHGGQSEARLDRRMDCLDRARVEVSATIDALREADARVVARAPSIASELPDLDACSDVERLDAIDLVPLARRAAFDPLFAELSVARAQDLAGRRKEALDLLERLVPRIENENFTGLAASALVLRGRVRRIASGDEAALADLTAGLGAALAVNDRRLATKAMLEIARTLGESAAGADEAMRWLDAAAPLARAAVGSDMDPITFAVARTGILLSAVRLPEAEAVARQALALPNQRPEPTGMRADLLLTLGQILEYSRRYSEALSVLQDGQQVAEAVYGADHPAVAGTLSEIAHCLSQLGRHDEAIATQRRALDIMERYEGERSENAARERASLARRLIGKGNIVEARRELDATLAIQREIGDESGELVTLHALADTGMDPSESADLLIAATPLVEKVHGAESWNMGAHETNIAAELGEAGAYVEGIPHAERGLAILEKALEPGHPDVAEAASTLAQLYAAVGRARDSAASKKRAAKNDG